MNERQLWDDLYGNKGLYQGAEPMPFMTQDIVPELVITLGSTDSQSVLDIGAGNGRNLAALHGLGLDRIVAVDISGEALRQLEAKDWPPDTPPVETIQGDVAAIPRGARFAAVLALHVFQHGTREAAEAGIKAAQVHVAKGGLFAFCAEATIAGQASGDDVRTFDDGSYTRYYDGQRPIHAFSSGQLDRLFDGFDTVLGPHYIESEAFAPAIGVAARWEAIWRRPA